MATVQVRSPGELGRQIRQRRKDVGLTAERTASLAGVSRRLLLELEQGKRPNVGLAHVLRILELLGVDVVLSPRGHPETGTAGA
jgi:transcriptional regulator with XRE-family HTH domain